MARKKIYFWHHHNEPTLFRANCLQRPWKALQVGEQITYMNVKVTVKLRILGHVVEIYARPNDGA